MARSRQSTVQSISDGFSRRSTARTIFAMSILRRHSGRRRNACLHPTRPPFRPMALLNLSLGLRNRRTDVWQTPSIILRRGICPSHLRRLDYLNRKFQRASPGDFSEQGRKEAVSESDPRAWTRSKWASLLNTGRACWPSAAMASLGGMPPCAFQFQTDPTPAVTWVVSISSGGASPRSEAGSGIGESRLTQNDAGTTSRSADR